MGASDDMPSANHDEAVLIPRTDLKRSLKLLLHQGSQSASVTSIGAYTLVVTQAWFGPSHEHPDPHDFRPFISTVDFIVSIAVDQCYPGCSATHPALCDSTNCGRFFTSSNIRPTYSPMIPITSSCTPEKNRTRMAREAHP